MGGVFDELLAKGKAIIKDSTKDVKTSLINRSVETFRQTKAGKSLEATATRQKIIELLPIIIIGILLIFIVARRIK